MNAKSALITCQNVSKVYTDSRGDEIRALDDLTLTIPHGEFLVVVGSSGCGKTTLLNILAGFEEPTTGKAFVEDVPITTPGADRGVVFQEYALFPWLTLFDNVAYGLREKGFHSKDAAPIVNNHLAMVGLAGFEHRYPHELSGGMRQRAALARVLVNEPKILLMDEPFAALDSQTRSILQKELAKLWLGTRKTIFFITHSVEEALLLAERVAVMTPRPGRLKTVVPIELAYPRDVTSPQFNDLRREIESLIFVEMNPQ